MPWEPGPRRLHQGAVAAARCGRGHAERRKPGRATATMLTLSRALIALRAEPGALDRRRQASGGDRARARLRTPDRRRAHDDRAQHDRAGSDLAGRERWITKCCFRPFSMPRAYAAGTRSACAPMKDLFCACLRAIGSWSELDEPHRDTRLRPPPFVRSRAGAASRASSWRSASSTSARVTTASVVEAAQPVRALDGARVGGPRRQDHASLGVRKFGSVAELHSDG